MVQVINESFLARGVKGKLGIKYSVSVLLSSIQYLFQLEISSESCSSGYDSNDVPPLNIDEK